MGQAGPDQFGALLPRIQTAWKAAGRTGAPKIVGHARCALGEQAEAGTDELLLSAAHVDLDQLDGLASAVL